MRSVRERLCSCTQKPRYALGVLRAPQKQSDLLRAPPRPPRTKRRSSRPFAPFRGSKAVRSSPCPSVSLRGQKDVLRDPSLRVTSRINWFCLFQHSSKKQGANTGPLHCRRGCADRAPTAARGNGRRLAQALQRSKIPVSPKRRSERLCQPSLTSAGPKLTRYWHKKNPK